MSPREFSLPLSVRRLLSCLGLAIAAALVSVPDAAAAPLKPLAVSSDGHHLVTGDGRPFFWLADTAWELLHRAGPGEAELYLRKRAEQGFNVVQVVALAELDGVRTPTPDGLRPFISDDPARPDERYFDRLAALVDEAGRRGLYVALLPTWGDKLTAPWGAGPRLFRTDKLAVAQGYARYLARKMCGRTNIVWMLGGDRPPTLKGPPADWWVRSWAGEAGFAADHDWRPIWRAMAKGIEDGACTKPLIAYHPQGGPESTSMLLAGEPWLAVNGVQSGHGGGRDIPAWETIARDYALKPAKPVIDLEINYEDHPVSPWPRWDAANGRFDDHDVRKQAYRTVFAGAAGVTYGHHSVWQWSGERFPGINHADRSWREALDRPGAWQMRHLRALMLARPYLTRVPAPELLPENGKGSRHAEATRAADRSWAYLYLPAAGSYRIALQTLRRPRLRLSWFDPRTGAVTPAGTVRTAAPAAIATPAGGEDWVLILDDPRRRFRRPRQASALAAAAAHPRGGACRQAAAGPHEAGRGNEFARRALPRTRPDPAVRAGGAGHVNQ